ncbi:zinc finger protein 652-A [Aedes aegypti]|uniref:C2H2-type domain-containing protein n=1 Tax=Aedes aegypti TaxID=7159 RepID=A0A6I8U9Y8_AEDAE|nr:zinc finger protein 652-A [Aedes aegypti]
MSDCLTCAKSADSDGGQSFAISSNRDIQIALCKHFWFDEDQYLQKTICYPCWHKIEDFHRFYCEVKQLHSRPVYSVIPLEVKREDQQLDFALGPAEQADQYVAAEGHGSDHELFEIKVEDPKVDFLSDLPVTHIESMKVEGGKDVINKDADLNNTTMVQIPDLPVLKSEDQPQPNIASEHKIHCIEVEDDDTLDENPDLAVLKSEDCQSATASEHEINCIEVEDDDGTLDKNPDMVVLKNEDRQSGIAPDQKLNCIEVEDDDDTLDESPDLVVLKSEDYQPDTASEHQIDCIEVEDDDDTLDQNGDDEESGNESRSSTTKRNKCRQRVQKNVKDAVQEYVSKNLVLDCDTCGEECSSFENLQRHSMMEHAKTATIICCNQKLSDNYRFVDHIRFHLDPEAFMCPHCSKQCGYRGELKKHIRMSHYGETKKSVGKVEQSRANKRKAVKEQKSDESEKSNSSEEEDDEKNDDNDATQNDSKPGGRLVISPEELAKIQLFVSKNIKLECDTCSEKCTTFKALQRHSMVRHRKRAIIQCCNRKLVNNFRFDDHMLFHVNPKRFICTLCTKQCPNWEALKRHIQLVHTPDSEKTHQCEICAKKFPTKLAASRHIKLHGESGSSQNDDAETDRLIAKKFNLMCDTCNLKCDTFQGLQRHSMAVHGRGTFVYCCGKKYSLRWKLLDHYYYHMDPTKFRCQVCLKSWPHSESLRQHMKNKHPEEARKRAKLNDA